MTDTEQGIIIMSLHINVILLTITVDQLTVEDVNKGYMDEELLGPDVRVALLGAEGSGKTCLSHTLVGKDFQDTKPTEGADHMEIVVESTTDWRPLTHEEKLRDLDKQKCLESMSSAVKKTKSQQPAVSSTPVSMTISTSSLKLESSMLQVSSTVVTPSTPVAYPIPAVSSHTVLNSISSSLPLSSISASCDPAVYSTSRFSTNSNTSQGFDPSMFLNSPSSSSISQHCPAKRQKLSSKNVLQLPDVKDSPFVSVRTIENLKAFKESYDPKKKYVNIWDFAGQQCSSILTEYLYLKKLCV